MDKLREAIKTVEGIKLEAILFRGGDFKRSLTINLKERDAIHTLIKTCSDLVALSGKVPGEKEVVDTFQGALPDPISRFNAGYNLGCHETLLAITGLLEVERLAKIVHSVNDMATSDIPTLHDLRVASAIRTGVINGEGK